MCFSTLWMYPKSGCGYFLFTMIGKLRSKSLWYAHEFIMVDLPFKEPCICCITHTALIFENYFLISLIISEYIKIKIFSAQEPELGRYTKAHKTPSPRKFQNQEVKQKVWTQSAVLIRYLLFKWFYSDSLLSSLLVKILRKKKPYEFQSRLEKFAA